MKCQYCDNEVPMGAPKCPSCGAPAPVPPPMPQQAPPYPQQQYGQQPMPPQYGQQPMPPQYGQQPMPPQYGQQPQIIINNMGGQVPVSDKSRITYILLGVFLGCFGIHNFYAGYTGRAIAQLLITVLTCGYGALIPAIWALIDICITKKTAAGIPMS